MNKKQENKLTMFEGLIRLLIENMIIVQALQAMERAFTAFRNKVTEIKQKDQEKSTTSAGKTGEKHAAERQLINTVLKVASLVFPWADENNNLAVKEICNIRKSHLSRVRDTELVKIATGVYQAGMDNLSSLTDYGVDEDLLNELNRTTTTYSGALGAKESGSAVQVSATASLVNLFHEADEILKNRLDRFVDGVQESHAEFHRAYKAARRIKNL